MQGRTYRYFTGSPLFAFGFGLSYTNFEYGQARVQRRKLVIPVTNIGTREADEVVQLYVRRPADAEGPLKSLRGFRRVTIGPGETVEVVFPLTDEVFLGWSDSAQDMVPLKDDWELLYGGSSDALQALPYSW